MSECIADSFFKCDHQNKIIIKIPFFSYSGKKPRSVLLLSELAENDNWLRKIVLPFRISQKPP